MGFTYVMSDLHGMYREYVQMLEQIHFSDDDRMYILGDVIDRGANGILLLQDIMSRENVTLLLGNHEDMMLSVVTLEECSGALYEKRMYQWSRNGGDVTAHDFYHNLNYKEQAKLIAFLESCPLCLPDVQVNGRCFYLVHAYPYLKPGVEGKIITLDKLDTLPEDGAEVKRRILWKRMEAEESFGEAITVVFGHTPTIYYQKQEKMRIWYGDGCINVDTGCAYLAHGRSEGVMSCLRLDDGAEFYLGE